MPLGPGKSVFSTAGLEGEDHTSSFLFPPLLSADAHAHAVLVSGDQLFVTPWAAARQAPLSMGFLRQEC